MAGYLVDTSIFIAIEQERNLGDPPDGEARISIATLTEILTGVHRAPTAAVRDARTETLDHVRRFIALPVDEAVAVPLAQLLAAALGEGRKASVMDAIIAATAIAHDLEVWTQDRGFDVLAELSPRLRIHRG